MPSPCHPVYQTLPLFLFYFPRNLSPRGWLSGRVRIWTYSNETPGSNLLHCVVCAVGVSICVHTRSPPGFWARKALQLWLGENPPKPLVLSDFTELWWHTKMQKPLILVPARLPGAFSWHVGSQFKETLSKLGMSKLGMSSTLDTALCWQLLLAPPCTF